MFQCGFQMQVHERQNYIFMFDYLVRRIQRGDGSETNLRVDKCVNTLTLTSKPCQVRYLTMEPQSHKITVLLL